MAALVFGKRFLTHGNCQEKPADEGQDCPARKYQQCDHDILLSTGQSESFLGNKRQHARFGMTPRAHQGTTEVFAAMLVCA